MPLDIEDALTRKIGPLPAWGWGAAILAGVWGVYYVRKVKGTNDTSVASDIGLGASTEDFSGHLEDTGLDNVTGVGAGTGGENTVSTGRPKSNAEWLSQAITYLADSFGYDRDEVATAVYAYVRGETLSIAQWTIVNLAKAHLGDPPDGVATKVPPPASGDIPKPDLPKTPKTDPKKPDPKKPAGYRKVTVTRWPSTDSTMWGIATHYLGKGTRWKEIWNDPQNATIVHKRVRPESIRPGDEFMVNVGS